MPLGQLHAEALKRAPLVGDVVVHEAHRVDFDTEEETQALGGTTTGVEAFAVEREQFFRRSNLLVENQLEHNRLRVGQELKLPASSAKNKTINYQVRRGDSLSSIAEKFQISVSELLRWNRLEKRHQLKPGQTLMFIRKWLDHLNKNSIAEICHWLKYFPLR